MPFQLYIQHSDKNRGDLEDLGIADVSSAVKLFENFDWKKEVKKIEERKFYHLTSTEPSLIIRNDDKKELIIQQLETNEFELSYKSNNKTTLFKITGDFNENPSGISVQNCIRNFYEGTLDNQFAPSTEVITPAPLVIGKYEPWSAFSWLIIMGTLSIFLGILLLAIIKPGKHDLLFFIPPAVLIIIGTIPLWFVYHYYRMPKIDSLIYDQTQEQITLKYRSGPTATISKKNIVQCAYVFNNSKSHRDPLKELFSLTLTINSGEQYYLTCLSFEKHMIEQLIDHLGINYYFIGTRLPLINKKVFPNELGSNLKNTQMKISELEESYIEKSDKALLNIIENPEDYEPEAIAMAKKIIKERKIG